MGFVLIVDDDPLNRRLLTNSLQLQGHRTAMAVDGASALRALADEEPDVVLLDIVMPGIDGIQVLEHIKEDPALAHLPVIVISGVDDADSVIRCIEKGAEDFLPKPFDAAILRARVNAGLARKSLHDLERERVRSVFGRFLPEPVVDEMLARTDGEATIAPEHLTASVLFADLRSFTTFAEERPVDEVIETLNRYVGRMADAVLDNGGTLIDVMGDGIMAVFGAPIPSDDHADLALDAARAMLGDHLPALNAWLRTRGWDRPFHMGVGVHSGPLLSGSVGSGRRLNYTVVGDAVNTASRIESMTKDLPFDGLLSDETYRSLHKARDDIEFAGEFDVRGRRSRIALWGVHPRAAAPLNGLGAVTGSTVTEVSPS